jgi:hypothetical protein
VKYFVAALVLGLTAEPASAEVRAVASSGFELEHRLETRLDPARLYRLLGDIGSWWSASHTYSGKAANLTLDLRPGGCWCEKLPDGGGVEHMRVVQAQPGKRLLLYGGLGPLINEASVGAMNWTITPSGTGTTLVMTYRVAGFYKADGAKWASMVDHVLATQMNNLHKTAEDLAVRR